MDLYLWLSSTSFELQITKTVIRIAKERLHSQLLQITQCLVKAVLSLPGRSYLSYMALIYSDHLCFNPSNIYRAHAMANGKVLELMQPLIPISLGLTVKPSLHGYYSTQHLPTQQLNTRIIKKTTATSKGLLVCLLN